MEEYLSSIYFNERNPASFSGINTFYTYVKKDGKYSLKKQEIVDWLKKQDVYTSHRSVKRKFQTQRVIVGSKHQQYDADTVNMTAYGKKNKGFKYILVMIDILSRYAFTRPMKDLKAKTMVAALKALHKSKSFHPKSCRSDRGKEFENKLVKQYLKGKNVKQFFTNNTQKANFAERFIKTLKTKLSKYMSKNHTHTWISILDDVTFAYNHHIHRAIHMSPSQALETEDSILWNIQYYPKSKTLQNQSKTHLKVNDTVKLSFIKAHFDREYQERWTRENFIITAVIYKEGIPLFSIKSWDNSPVSGLFYKDELQKVFVDANTVYDIEKIIKTRKYKGTKQAYVKWLGWPKQYCSWINFKDLKNYKQT